MTDLQLRRRGRLRWAAVAASAKRHACQPLSMPGSARRSVLLLRRPAPWGVGARGVPQTGGAAGIRWSCLRRVRFTCAERGVSAVVAGTAPAVGWSAGRGAPLEAAGVFRRSSRWVDKMACKPGSLRFAAGGIRIGRGEVISGKKRCGRGSWCGLSARSRRFLGLISPPCPCHLSFLWCGSTASCIAEPHSAALCSTRGHSLSLYPAARSHESRRTAPPTSLRQQLPEHSIPATSEEHTA